MHLPPLQTWQVLQSSVILQESRHLPEETSQACSGPQSLSVPQPGLQTFFPRSSRQTAPMGQSSEEAQAGTQAPLAPREEQFVPSGQTQTFPAAQSVCRWQLSLGLQIPPWQIRPLRHSSWEEQPGTQARLTGSQTSA